MEVLAHQCVPLSSRPFVNRGQAVLVTFNLMNVYERYGVFNKSSFHHESQFEYFLRRHVASYRVIGEVHI